jgi:hypothetical protein
VDRTELLHTRRECFDIGLSSPSESPFEGIGMRPLTFARWLVVLVLAPCLAFAHSEQRLPTGDTVRWHRRSVRFVVDPSMFDHTTPDPLATVMRAADAWRGNGYVPRFEIVRGVVGSPGYDPERQDNTSGIAIYRKDFPHRLDRAVLALTLLTRNSTTGEVVDADVIIDAERNRFAEIVGPGMLGITGAPNDYLNVITHEFGHVIGLIEDPNHPESTMFPSSQPGEVSKRELARVDRESAARAYASPPSSIVSAYREFFATNSERFVSRLLALLSLTFLGYAAVSKRSRVGWVLAGLSLLGLAIPSAQPRTVAHGLVLRASTRQIGTTLVTRADVQTIDGTVTVERLGGRRGVYEQQCLDAPSGTALRPGATVSLPELH